MIEKDVYKERYKKIEVHTLELWLRHPGASTADAQDRHNTQHKVSTLIFFLPPRIHQTPSTSRTSPKYTGWGLCLTAVNNGKPFYGKILQRIFSEGENGKIGNGDLEISRHSWRRLAGSYGITITIHSTISIFLEARS